MAKKARNKWGQRVDKLRPAKTGFSRRALAKRLGMSTRTFNGWFTQKRERDHGLAVSVKLASLLQCPIAELMDPETRKEYLSLPDVAPPPVETQSERLITALGGLDRAFAAMRADVEGKEE